MVVEERWKPWRLKTQQTSKGAENLFCDPLFPCRLHRAGCSAHCSHACFLCMVQIQEQAKKEGGKVSDAWPHCKQRAYFIWGVLAISAWAQAIIMAESILKGHSLLKAWWFLGMPSPGWVGLGMQELHSISVAEKVCFGKWGFSGVRNSIGIPEWTWPNLFMVSHLPDGRLSCCYLSMAVPSCRKKRWGEKLINAKFDYICKPGFYERKNKNDLTFKLARRWMEIEGCVIGVHSYRILASFYEGDVSVITPVNQHLHNWSPGWKPCLLTSLDSSVAVREERAGDKELPSFGSRSPHVNLGSCTSFSLEPSESSQVLYSRNTEQQRSLVCLPIQPGTWPGGLKGWVDGWTRWY